MSLIEESAAAQACPHCGGSLPCQPCSRNIERPGVTRKGDTAEVTLPPGADRDRITAMLAARGLDPEDWQLDRVTVNEWEGFHVDGDGETVVVPLHQTKAYLTWRPPFEETPWGQFLNGLKHLSGPLRSPRKSLKPDPGPLTWVLFGDDQAPFVNMPLHELLCEVLAELQPDGLVHMGDLADLPGISKHRPKQGTMYTAGVLECVDVAYRVMAERVEAAGDASLGRRLKLRGNHDARFDSALAEKLPQLFGLRQSKSTEHPDPEPLLTVHHLARLNDLGFDAVTDPRGDYPYGSVQIADELLATHGWIAVRGGGASAQKSIEHLNSGIAVGHTHRIAHSYVTKWSPEGEPLIYSAIETGTLADPDGLGYTRYPDWQPGFATVTTRKDGTHHADLAVYRKRTLRWRDQQWRLTARGVRR